MRRWTTTGWAARCAAVGATLTLALGACGDDGLESTGGDDASDVPFFETVDDVGGDLGPDDAGEEDADAGEDVTPDLVEDTAPDGEDDVAPDGGEDVAPDADASDPPDLIPDTTPPTVLSTSPEAGESNVAVPFTVTITFDEPIADNTIAAGTVKLFNYNEQEVPVSLSVSEDGATVTLEPNTENFYRASPYRVWLAGGIIADKAGNDLVENYEFTFYTENFEDMDAYHDLAGQYAPRIYADTSEGSAQAHVPTKFDADGDWDGTNTKSWLQSDAETLIPAVYYDLSETCTHYYIHYTYLFPWTRTKSNSTVHANGSLGIMVTVEKAHDEVEQRPVAVTTYWKQGQFEENVVFATEESGIVGPLGPGQYGDVEGVYPQADLFPGGHFQSYVSPEYESCAWIHHTDPGFTAKCVLNDGVKAGMSSLIFAFQGGAPTPVEKDFGWPGDMADFQEEGEDPVDSLGYALIPTLSTLWPRRTQVGDGLVYGATFDYSVSAGRPGDGSKLPSGFVESESYSDVDNHFGRPVWAWKYNPSQGSVFGIEQGWIGVDPAWYTCSRHGSIELDSAVPPCNTAESEGFSVSYRFNPYASIDERADPEMCAPPEE
ncbi:MAG: Ig-like domain-containing protein [Myxococcota bacterium]